MNTRHDTVLRKIRQVFPQRDEHDILTILKAYGSQSHETDVDRVYLAILKLCDEERVADPSRYIELAKQDVRDVLAWAEYPNQMTFGPTKDPEKSAELLRQDREQYDVWIDNDRRQSS